jgi:radical SAM superfamily enzyme YgiQ (UPF0313 family)
MGAFRGDLEEVRIWNEARSEEDIRNRLIYVEASRGCPFKCEFCLSSLDKTAKAFSIDFFLAEMDLLLERGVRNFKFIDRKYAISPNGRLIILELINQVVRLFYPKKSPKLDCGVECQPNALRISVIGAKNVLVNCRSVSIHS